ncbi:MAG: tetratricopeptide repeat protein, partial [Opitutaceae bacterium]|nr:tetratricopeptide repeat protein [Opitutaceae bacterium]
MTRVRTWVVAGVGLLALGVGALVWRGAVQRRAWEEERPMLPPPAGARAPGLDARLQSCFERLGAYPPDHAALEEFARLCHANGLLESAVDAYRVLVRLQPADGRWSYMLAVIDAGYGRLPEAITGFRNATRLSPEHVPGWLRLGAALLKADDGAGATAAYEEALRRAPDEPFALLGLARCALREERWTAARGLLQRAVAANPRMAPALHLLATVHERLGSTDSAAAALIRADAAAMEIDPPDPWLDDLYQECYDVYRLRVIAATALAGGNLERALTVCERARSLAPDDARVHWQFGRIHHRVGHYDEARAAYTRAVELDPGDDKALLDLID